jgi:hypothetical protein
MYVLSHRIGARFASQFSQKWVDVEMDASLTTDVVCVRLGDVKAPT